MREISRFGKRITSSMGKKVPVIRIVIGAFGTVPKAFRSRLHQIGIQANIETMQTAVLLNTTRIIRKV